MGVVNVTPDSFSDGGLFLDAQAAVQHGLGLIEQGADILDIGGESTRPGAEPVDDEEEKRRVLPVIEGLARRGGCRWRLSRRTDSRSTPPRRPSPAPLCRGRELGERRERAARPIPRWPGSWPTAAPSAA